MSSTSGSSDPYLYPGTAVLKNLRGLIDPRQLEAFEGRNTHRRLAELIEGPFTTGFDVPHLKAIHRYIFQDVFEWAGEFRTVELSKDGHLFARPTFVEPTLEQTLRNLAGEGCLAGLDATSFADRAAFYLSELNAAHPFREGNGRTQREFMRELGLNAGHYLDWRRTTRGEMLRASRLSHLTGDSSDFAQIIGKCIAPGL